jgi:putative transposase
MTYSKDLRQRVLAAVAQGMPPTTASRTFQVSRATLYRWLANPEPKPLPKIRNRKLDPQQLLDHVRRYPDARLRDRAAEFGVCPSAISYRLKQLKVTRKKTVSLSPTLSTKTAALPSSTETAQTRGLVNPLLR